jgi:hypothetical protein
MKKKYFVAVIATVVMTLFLAVFLADTSPLQRLVLLNPGMTVPEMQADLEAAAVELGMTYDEVLAQALAEAEAHVEGPPAIAALVEMYWYGLDTTRMMVALALGALSGIAVFWLMTRHTRRSGQAG